LIAGSRLSQNSATRPVGAPPIDAMRRAIEVAAASSRPYVIRDVRSIRASTVGKRAALRARRSPTLADRPR
jgi:hypothetical protein